MSPAPSPRGFAVLVGAAILLVIYTHAGFSFGPISSSMTSSPGQRRAGDDVLPIPSSTYVISLPHRTDRYEDMERLRSCLGLRWTYVVAEDSQSPLVDRIISQVRSLRQEELKMKAYPPNTSIELPFQWPSPDTATSTVPFQGSNSDTPLYPVPAASDSTEPLTCATENFTLFPYSPGLPEYKVLSRSRIACWHSHLSVIQRVSTHAPENAALILEDDVDMEADIKERLSVIWNLLPSDWDIVFLGHCWSNESFYPPLGHISPPSPHLHTSFTTKLHLSHAPLCTHAYALSPAGAKRLLRDLTYPRFAYSRAIDHALAWLVQSGRLNSFSVVPSVVVQRKIGESDVMTGKGSGWKDQLIHGVLADEESP
ncbi:hypothetical protein MVEN_01967200 [Mycena venus]|uniref:Glycosyl transferase family 25 domain-containing protein n=1 Tax=Mycena venus TaxID=2733690 RepID=A0A8H6XGV3_9AGAR|nr:hypothetical protein MVEN_01967200 [Mycena venus]